MNRFLTQNKLNNDTFSSLSPQDKNHIVSAVFDTLIDKTTQKIKESYIGPVPFGGSPVIIYATVALFEDADNADTKSGTIAFVTENSTAYIYDGVSYLVLSINPISSSNLVDFDLTVSMVNGSRIAYNTISGLWESAAPLELQNLNNVAISMVSDLDTLFYDSSSGIWRNSPLPTIPQNISEMDDYDNTSTPNNNSIMVYSTASSKWIPKYTIPNLVIQDLSSGRQVAFDMSLITDNTAGIYRWPAVSSVHTILTNLSTVDVENKTLVEQTTYIKNNNNCSYKFISALTTNKNYLLENITANDTVVMKDHTQTLTNKTLTDATNSIAAKYLKFATNIPTSAVDPTTSQVLTYNGTSMTWGTPAGGATTLSALTDITINSVSDMDLLVYETATSKWKNTKLDTRFMIVDNADTNKKMNFDCVNISSGATRTMTVPNSSGTLVLETMAQTLTNKTITDNTNSIICDRIKTSGTAVSISATAPTTGQMLIATSATGAAWQTYTPSVINPSIMGSGDVSLTNLAVGQTLVAAEYPVLVCGNSIMNLNVLNATYSTIATMNYSDINAIAVTSQYYIGFRTSVSEVYRSVDGVTWYAYSGNNFASITSNMVITPYGNSGTKEAAYYRKDINRLYVCGSNKIATSDDGGKTWVLRNNSGNSNALAQIGWNKKTGSNSVMLAGGNDLTAWMFYSTNNGDSWTNFSTTATNWSFAFFDDGTAKGMAIVANNGQPRKINLNTMVVSQFVIPSGYIMGICSNTTNTRIFVSFMSPFSGYYYCDNAAATTPTFTEFSVDAVAEIGIGNATICNITDRYMLVTGFAQYTGFVVIDSQSTPPTAIKAPVDLVTTPVPCVTPFVLKKFINSDIVASSVRTSTQNLAITNDSSSGMFLKGLTSTTCQFVDISTQNVTLYADTIQQTTNVLTGNPTASGTLTTSTTLGTAPYNTIHLITVGSSGMYHLMYAIAVNKTGPVSNLNEFTLFKNSVATLRSIILENGSSTRDFAHFNDTIRLVAGDALEVAIRIQSSGSSHLTIYGSESGANGSTFKIVKIAN